MAETLDNFKEAVMALVLVALVIAALALALNGFQDAIKDDVPDRSISNESFTFANATATALASDCIERISCTALHNGTALIGSGNYSCSGNAITVTDLDGTVGFATTLNVTYSCGQKDYQYNITQEGLEGTANASSYLSTIGTLIGVGALIAVVIMAFYFVKR